MHENQGDAPSSVEGVTDLNQHFSEVIKRVGDGTLDANDVHGILENILDSTSRRHDSEIAIDRFTAPSAQIENLRSWNRLLGGAWTSDELDGLKSDVPEFDDEEPLIPLTLCWTLDSLASSIEAKIEVMRHVYGADRVQVTSKFKTDSKHTSVVSGGPAFEPRRLWWQLIDLGANRFKAPNQVPAATAAGCEVFDVICQHPIYVSQQDGSETPYLDLPGLSVKVRGFTGPDTPDATGGPEGKVAVHVNWEGSVYSDHAEPVREEA